MNRLCIVWNRSTLPEMNDKDWFAINGFIFQTQTEAIERAKEWSSKTGSQHHIFELVGTAMPGIPTPSEYKKYPK